MVFTAVLMISWYLIIAQFLQQAPGLVVIGLLLTITISLVLMPSSQTRKQYKAMFLAGSAISAGFAAGLYSGLFESVTLLPDSYIDTSRSLALLHLRNNGLTDLALNEIKLGNSSFTFGYDAVRLGRVQRGYEAYFVIYYPEKSLQISDEAPHLGPIYAGPDLIVDQEVDPSAFQNGLSYPAVLTTNSILRHTFNIEARRTMDEELDVQASARLYELYEHTVEFSIRFNNTGSYLVHLYSIEIADVVFYPRPPAMVVPYQWSRGTYQVLELRFFEAPRLSWSSSMSIRNISAIPQPQLSMLTIGETYEIRVRTMTDNIYVTSVTV